MIKPDEKLVTFKIDGRAVEARPGETILRAALDHGIEIPYYCWHAGLSVVASCRLCLVEIDDIDPKSGELKRVPKLIPSCKEPVKEGIAVWTRTERVKTSQRAVMEFLLLNHPLDCPVCDQAGECYLQDFSYRYGPALSRMIDPKTKQAKKDTGERLVLYADRCILCSRCVRFCREVSGGGELAVVDRADRCEIDLFPGNSVEHKLSGNIADICPVGAFLDKEFLFRERVWYMTAAPSICSGCASGCAIWIDHRDERIGRFRPRYNPKVNEYWMCDDGRALWRQVYRPDRLLKYRLGRTDDRLSTTADQAADALKARLRDLIDQHGPGRLAVVLSPMLDCELIYMICRFVRDLDDRSILIVGPQFETARDETFKSGFTIRASKVPNARGLAMILAGFAGPQMPLAELEAATLDGRVKGLWITGGYFDDTLEREINLADKPELLIVSDSFAGTISRMADLVLPMTVWTEREGSFVNHAGLIQPFERAVIPPMGIVPDGQWLAKLIGLKGIYRAETIRKELAELLGGFQTYEPPKLSEMIH